MDYNLGRTKRFANSALHFVRDRVSVGNRRGPGNAHGHLGENHTRCSRARTDASHLGNPRNAFDQAPNVRGVETALIDENGNRLLEDLVAVPGNDQGDQYREDRVQRAEADASQPERSDREERDVDVAVRVGGVRYQEGARELTAASTLVDDHECVDHECQSDDAELEQAGTDRRMRLPELKDRLAQQLEARDGQEGDDGESAKRLELRVTVRVRLVGRAGSNGYQNHPDDIVQQ